MLVGQISNTEIHHHSTSISNHHEGAISLEEPATLRVDAQSAVICNEVPSALSAGITQLHDERARSHLNHQFERVANIAEVQDAVPLPIVHDRHIIRSNIPFRLAIQAHNTKLEGHPGFHAASLNGLAGDVTYNARLPPGWEHPVTAGQNLLLQPDMPSAQMQAKYPKEGSVMIPSSGDLAILGAESYDVGIKYPSASRTLKRSKKTADKVTVTEIPTDVPAKKRRKAPSSDDVVEEDERTKRGRGRPRLEPRDETAQERRRTQIRLAQRAYRDRKENAIQTLERQVQELKKENEEMNNAFLRLHDFAVKRGLPDRMPDVGRQLRETSEKFLKLARKPSTDDSPESDKGYEEDSPRTMADPQADEMDISSFAQSQQHQLYGGFIITQEPVPTSTRQLPLSPPVTSSISTPSIADPQLDYEVITYPTLDNASFPFGFKADFSFSPSSLSTPMPTTPAADFNPSVYPALPLPLSHAGQETTFGRRFQRIALERALYLVNMPNPPAHRINRAFGFCLLFESLSSIKDRLQRGIDKTYNQSLMYWPYPFQSLGGAGGHFPSTSSSSSSHSQSGADPGRRLGNQGTEDIGRVKQGNGFSMGPFEEKVMAARDLVEGDSSMYDMFGEDFYDSDELEIYLFQRGVSIPAGADYVAVEVEQAAFGADKGRLDMALGSSSSGTGASSPALSTRVEKSPIGTANGYGQQTDLWTAGGQNLFSTFGDFGAYSTSPKKRLTVDVNRLIDELVNRATCLGRSPGLRREEIDAAFWKAARPAT